MKKLVLIITLLLGSLAFAKQYVYSECVQVYYWIDPTALEKAHSKCVDFILQGYRIVSIAVYANGYLIVYEDEEVQNDK